MNKSKKGNKKISFDEDKFDRKVAQSIYNIHTKVKKKMVEKTYNKWCDDNMEHLKKLYDLSGLDFEFDEFCSYVFNNSEISRKLNVRYNVFFV